MAFFYHMYYLHFHMICINWGGKYILEFSVKNTTSYCLWCCFGMAGGSKGSAQKYNRKRANAQTKPSNTKAHYFFL